MKLGEVIKVAGVNWTVLDKTEKGYLCLGKNIERMKFGTSNDWKESTLRIYLNQEFYDKLVKEIGADNIVKFERDLLSLDGQTEYGTCEDLVSLLTVDEYRKYRKFIPNAGYYWWTLTPDSTPCNEDNYWIRVVSPSGSINDYVCGNRFGVRPVCIFSSSLFESEEE